MSSNKVWSKDAMDVDNVWDDTELIKMYEESIKEVYTPAKSGVTENKFTMEDGTEYLWKVGGTCMAPHTENGETEHYAARIDSFGGEGNTEVTVTFIYYGNTAVVRISDLWQNKDAVAQAIQLEETIKTEGNNKKSRQSSGKQFVPKPSTSNPSVPLPVLAPPVPPNVINMVPPNQQEALSSMLMSWYMSGYHTGYYQAMNDRQADK